MNRQVVPSILLSILFVSFFSIVLHQPDPPPVTDAKSPPRSSTTRREVYANPIVADDRLGMRRELVPTSDASIRMTKESRPESTSKSDEDRPTIQYRKIRTVPRDIGATSRDPLAFPPPTTDRELPVEGGAGRWRKVR